MKKILIALLSLGLVSPVLAQEKMIVEKVTSDKDTLVLQMKQPPFYVKMRGMSDVGTPASIARSKAEGVALQHVLFMNNGIEEAGVEKDKVIAEVDEFTSKIGKYYKLHPELKGGFIVEFTIFPGYQTPFQINLNNVPKEQVGPYTELNKVIKEKSVCNKDKMCAITVSTTAIFFNPENPKLQLNNQELQNFIAKQPSKNIDVFTKNPKYLRPITYLLVYGTNGYHVEQSQVKKVLGIKN